MESRQIIGLVGSAILFIGVFMPIVSIPITGSINYFQNGKGDGTIIIALAVISLVLVFGKKFKALAITGAGALGMLLYSFIIFQRKIAITKSEMEGELAGNPFMGLADAALESIQLQWGWALLVIGCALLIGSAFMQKNLPDSPGP